MTIPVTKPEINSLLCLDLHNHEKWWCSLTAPKLLVTFVELVPGESAWSDFLCARAMLCSSSVATVSVSAAAAALSTDYYKILASDLYLPSIKLTFRSDSIQFLLLWCEYSRLLSDCRPVTRWHHLYEPTVTSKRRRFCVSLNFESQRKAKMEFHRRNGTTAGLIFNISPSGKIFPLMSCRLLNFRKNSFSLKLF